MDLTLKIVIVDESPVRSAIIEEGLREAGFSDVVPTGRGLFSVRGLDDATFACPECDNPMQR